jgi:hypothetical protein
VQKLVALNPQIIIPGHGTAMQGEELQDGLQQLIKDWNEAAVPDHGKWIWNKR